MRIALAAAALLLLAFAFASGGVRAGEATMERAAALWTAGQKAEALALLDRIAEGGGRQAAHARRELAAIHFQGLPEAGIAPDPAPAAALTHELAARAEGERAAALYHQLAKLDARRAAGVMCAALGRARAADDRRAIEVIEEIDEPDRGVWVCPDRLPDLSGGGDGDLLLLFVRGDLERRGILTRTLAGEMETDWSSARFCLEYWDESEDFYRAMLRERGIEAGPLDVSMGLAGLYASVGEPNCDVLIGPRADWRRRVAPLAPARGSYADPVAAGLARARKHLDHLVLIDEAGIARLRRAREAEARKAAMAHEQRLAAIAEGTAEGYGFLHLAPPPGERSGTLCHARSSKEEAALLAHLREQAGDHRVLDELGLETLARHPDLESVFVAMKRRDCDAFVGPGAALDALRSAFVRDGYPASLARDWIGPKALADARVRAAELAEQGRRAARERAAAAAERKAAEAACRADPDCRADREAERRRKAEARTEHERHYPFVAEFTCEVLGATAPLAACLQHGDLKIYTDRVGRSFAIDEVVGRTRLEVELTERFRILALPGGADNLTLALVIRDRAGDIVFRDEAPTGGVMKIRN